MRLKRFLFVAGILIFLYPTISDWWNSFHQSLVISRYENNMDTLGGEEQDDYWKQAVEYNQKIEKQGFRGKLNKEEQQEYDSLLNISGDGLMGYIVIPAIECRLPIYHGTEESILQIGAGHMNGTSLPVGGESSHCVLSGHRGLPSAKLFSNLDQLKKGDIFKLCVLKEELYYQVNQIRIVLPEDTDVLEIEKGKDLCTLVTCTPYGINTHRLLVSGKRITADEWNQEIGEKEMDSEAALGGRKMKEKNLAKWAVVCLLLVLYWTSSKTNVHAQQFYEIKIKYPFSHIEFQLYQIDSENKSEDLLQSGMTDEKGELIFEGIKNGQYVVKGQGHVQDGYEYFPMGSYISVPMNEEIYSHQIIINLKYEKNPLAQDEEDSQEETSETQETTEESQDNLPETSTEGEGLDKYLPQTGQQWTGILMLLLSGMLFLIIGWIRRKE